MNFIHRGARARKVTIHIGVTMLSYTRYFQPQKILFGEIQTKIRVSGPHKVFKKCFLRGEKMCV